MKKHWIYEYGRFVTENEDNTDRKGKKGIKASAIHRNPKGI